MRKQKIACNKQFLLFSQSIPYMVLIFHFTCTLKCIQTSLNLDQSKNFLSGYGLNNLLTIDDIRRTMDLLKSFPKLGNPMNDVESVSQQVRT